MGSQPPFVVETWTAADGIRYYFAPSQKLPQIPDNVISASGSINLVMQQTADQRAGTHLLAFSLVDPMGADGEQSKRGRTKQSLILPNVSKNLGEVSLTMRGCIKTTKAENTL